MVNFLTQRSRSIVIIIAFSVFILGVIYSISLGNSLRYPDEKEYFQIASNIVSYHIYSLDGVNPSAYRPPAYPISLTLFIKLGANPIALRSLNFFLLSGSIILLYGILKKQKKELAGVIASILIVFYPVLFYTAGTLYPQTFASFVILLIIFLMDKTSLSRNLIVGFLWGVLILAAPLYLYLLPIALIFYFAKSPKHILIILAEVLFIVSLWTIRNYYQFNSFVLFSSNSGINLLLGNSENTRPNSGVNVDISKYQITGLNEIEQDSFYRSKAVEYILKNPVRTIKLYFAKMVNFFNYRNDLATQSEASQIKDLIMLCSYGLLLGLFILRVLFYKKFPFSCFEIFLTTMYLMSPFFHAIFFTRIRFRLPMDYFLIIIAALFLSFLLSKKYPSSFLYNEIKT